MTSAPAPTSELHIRPVQREDLEAVEQIFVEAFTEEYGSRSISIQYQIQRLRRWFGPVKFLSLFPNRFQHVFTVQVAEQAGQIKGVIQVSPFNHARTTWRVDHIAVASNAQRQGVGSRLLRHCMEHFRDACTWILEVNIQNSGAMALYRQNGFQPLAQVSYWSLSPEVLAALAQHQPQLPPLLPVSSRDAALLYQLDTYTMPPIVRQVYHRDIGDFQSTPLDWAIDTAKQSISQTERVEAYVCESDRKAAIGYFNLKLSRSGSQPHVAKLTVHPQYTWLYPELMAEMARRIQIHPPQALMLASTDYQPEREEYLRKLGAEVVERTLLMSRSVWHKLRESRLSLENLDLNAVLRSLQQPLPERMDALHGEMWAEARSSEDERTGSC